MSRRHDCRQIERDHENAVREWDASVARANALHDKIRGLKAVPKKHRNRELIRDTYEQLVGTIDDITHHSDQVAKIEDAGHEAKCKNIRWKM